MANPSPKKKPRIRKTAPTIRQRVESAAAEPEKKRAIKLPALRVSSPLKHVRLPENKLTSYVRQILAPFGKVLSKIAPRYFVNSWREVRQVTWPSRKESWRLTLAVFVFAIVFGALVAGVDKGLDVIFKKLVLK